MQSLINHIQNQLNITVTNQKMIQQAFFHRSYINEQGEDLIHSNERLEFLGDAVLEILVSQFLYEEYPNKPEGDLSKMRAQLVREPSLAYLARQVDFPKYVQLGKGEKHSGGSQRDSILADTFEAFLGAVYLDAGMEMVKSFLTTVLFDHHQAILTLTVQDYKTKFQELVQVKGTVKIEYRLLSTEGPSHAQTFTIGLYLDDQLIAKASGKSKKEAEMKAAEKAIHHLQKGV
ncbi:ribonuclease III [Facklamia miroungae]|uniref:Ribonuclease 3 n=1 Tax=Facklamia miroungae TaxID=120956 RepID=A0A1G7PRT9_9LACT|nr:ribonuclease III [Facklamia miroungae]NKZ28782.1 ribonuclease III [Facklamia miroungae]SDF88130.1 ribonuclease-3 [Facklamia miroungae]